MTRRVGTWGPVAVTVAAGALMMGAEPVAPRAFPPLPVPPVEHRPMAPFLARFTISGDPKASGVFEECVDMASRVRPRPRPAAAPPPMTGCTTAYEVGPGGSIHHELSCDRAKGATATMRMIRDGTEGDMHIHMERYEPDTASGASKATIVDGYMVRLGPCPADLKPGQKRRPGGPVLEPGEASRFLDDAEGMLR